MSETRVNGVRIAYEVTGEGRPLVFLHCWTGNRTFYFEQVERFSRDYACVSLDFPGHGESGRTDSYTVESFGELTAGLMGKLGIEDAVLVGHSLGGMVALYLALEHSSAVDGLVLLDTTAHLCSSFVQRVESAAASALGRFSSRPARGLVAGIAATHPLAGPRARFITARECRKVSGYVMVRTMDSLRRFDVSDRLGEILQPALIIVGSADMLADVRHAKRMARGLPNSTMKVVRGAGHMALFEKPEVVNDAVGVFLERVYPPTALPGRGGARVAPTEGRAGSASS